MTIDTHVSGKVDNTRALKNIFSEIRDDVDKADSSFELTELYNQAGYLITLANDYWKFVNDIDDIRSAAGDEFGRTARKINSRAETIGTQGNYHEIWAG